MKTSEFFFELPENLIAQHPPEKRGQSRLLLVNRVTGKRQHAMVHDLPEILAQPELQTSAGPPLMVFNNSRVRKARLIGTSSGTGAKVEFLLLEKMGRKSDSSATLPKTTIPDPRAPSSIWKALVQRSKRRKNGSTYIFFDDAGAEFAKAEIVGGEGEYRLVAFDRPVDDQLLDAYGHMPLPPYIKRNDNTDDASRYQTVYAAATGSAAAPTAGLHFTEELMQRIQAAGVETAFITLHVGLGTFLPVRSANLEDHIMHEETFSIDNNTAKKIEEAKAAGRKIIAAGTTSVRTLESAWTGNKILRGEGKTSIFIYPGYQFKIVDSLFTNFHTPESTLLMLVSAFAGRELILESYAEAVKEGYRFFSYGDAMLIV